MDENTRFTRLFSAAQRDGLVRLAYRFLWNHDDAEDVAQDALATAYRESEDLRDDDRWWPWLCRIVIRRCHEHGRQKQRRRKYEAAMRDEANRNSAEPKLLDSAEAKAQVSRLLQDLPRRQREVLVLRHLQGMSCEEVGDVLDIAPATVRVHTKAAREALRRRLTEEFPEWAKRGTRTEVWP